MAEGRHDDHHRPVSRRPPPPLTRAGIHLSCSIKNLVKLQGGEYIALERLEMSYKTSHYVANACVHATSESQKPIVIIFPHEVHLKDALAANAKLPSPDSDIHKLCADPAVQEFYL